MPNFTKEFINSIKANNKQQNLKDDKEAGLYITVSPKGVKTFYLIKKIKGKTERVKIGRYPDLTIFLARKRCAEIKQQIQLGNNPNEIKRKKQAESTLQDLFNIYLANHIKEHNKNEKYYLTLFNKHLKPLHNLKLSQIDKLKVLNLHSKIGSEIGKRTANKTITLLGSMFNRGIDWDIWHKTNPTRGIKKYKELPREQYLQEVQELAFFTALDNHSSEVMKSFFYMLLYTGARSGELRSMRWQDIYTEKGITCWKYIQPKTENIKIVPFITQALTILENLKKYSKNEYVFYSKNSKRGYIRSPQKAWKSICNEAGIDNLRIHDMRHTGATWLSSAGTSSYLIRDYLGRANATTTDIYVNKDIKALLQAIQDIFDNLKERLNAVR